MQYQQIDIKTNRAKGEAGGSLSVFEAGRDIPFEIKRIYYIHGVGAGEVRGFHAHKQLQQLLFCPFGQIRILLDDGNETCYVDLDDPSKGLVVAPMVWHTMEWLTDGALLCVAASDYYFEDDYLRDYEGFLAYKKEKDDETNGS